MRSAALPTLPRAATTNWSNAGAPDRFWPADAVVFDDSSTNGSVILAGDMAPRSVVVSNASRSYNFSSGSLSGDCSLVKQGTGALTLSASNGFTGGLFLNGGSVTLANDTANTHGPGAGPITFGGGALTMFDDLNSYNACTWNLIVPAGQTGSLTLDSRCDFYGALTGGGTLNLKVAWVRSTLYGDWSGFTGQMNVAPRSGSAEFRLVHPNGLPAASVFLSNSVTAYPTFDDGTIEVGELAGASGAVLGPGNGNGANPTWLVGGKNTSATFAGQIRDAGVTKVLKVGSGAWTLSGSNSFSGGLVVSNGAVLEINSSGVFAGTLALAAGTSVRGGTGTHTFDGVANISGNLSLNGVTKPLTLTVEFEGATVDPWGNARIGFSASGELDRDEFGVSWNQALETGGVVVGKTVKLEIDAEAVRPLG